LGEFKRASNELRSTLDEEIRIEEQRSADRQQDPATVASSVPPDETVPRESGTA
jgi:Sec-independent protein translocase protein TatA